MERTRGVSVVAECGYAPGSVELRGWQWNSVGTGRNATRRSGRGLRSPISTPRVPKKWSLSRRPLAIERQVGDRLVMPPRLREAIGLPRLPRVAVAVRPVL